MWGLKSLCYRDQTGSPLPRPPVDEGATDFSRPQLIKAGNRNKTEIRAIELPKLPTPADRETWETMFKQGWPIKDIAEKTNFSADTVSKHLQEKGVKKEEAVKKEPVDIGGEFAQFREQQQLAGVKKDLKKIVEDRLSELNFDGAGDFRTHFKWVLGRTDTAQSEDELRDLIDLVATITNEALPLIVKHEEEEKRKRAEEDRIRAEAEEGERLRLEQEAEEERLRKEKQREEDAESSKAWSIRRAELQVASYNTISVLMDQMGLRVPEQFKTAYLARNYEEALWYVQAVPLWLNAGGTPDAFFYFLQTDPIFLQRVHATYGCVS